MKNRYAILVEQKYNGYPVFYSEDGSFAGEKHGV